MITLNDTPTTNETDIIWVLEIVDDAKTYYIADESITLSGQAYSNVLLKDSLSQLSKSINISDGGSIGSVGNFHFSIADKTSDSDWDDLFDDFYPNNTTYLTGREVKVGCVFSGATTQAEITWFASQKIESIKWDVSYDIECIEFTEYESLDLPPYEVQESYDNEISYFTNALKESYGQPIPIIYGSFPQATVANIRQFDYSLAPTVPVDKLQLKFLVACHKCDSFAVSQTYKYFEDIESYFQLKGKKRLGAGSYSNIEAVSNTRAGCTSALLNEGGFVDGHGYVHPTVNKGDFINDGNSYTPTEQTNNLFDRDLDTSVTLSPGESLHIGIDADSGSSDLAETTLRSSILSLRVKTQAVGGNQDFTIRLTDPFSLNQTQLDAGNLSLIELSGSPPKVYKTSTATTSETLWDFDIIINEFDNQPFKNLLGYGIYIESAAAGNDLKVFEVYWEITSVNRSLPIQHIIKRKAPRLRTNLFYGWNTWAYNDEYWDNK